MSELIRRDEILAKECCGRISANDVRQAPAVDAVEVVRCVECWHRFTGHFGMMCIGRPNDFFCANGERREENAVD